MMDYTLAYYDINGKAGQVAEEWRWILQQEFSVKRGCHTDYYAIEKNGLRWDIVAKPGLVWDYATGWFDYDAMVEASLGHDILSWLIQIGIVDADDNDKIDREFYLMLREFGVPHWRAKWLRRGTNLYNTSYTGRDRAVTYLNNGKRVAG